MPWREHHRAVHGAAGGGPSANFSFVKNNLQVQFTDTSTSSAPITSRAWTFGDGIGSSSGTNPLYTYAAAGTYTVSLTVTDSNGAQSTKNTSITVSASPPNPIEAPMPAGLWTADMALQMGTGPGRDTGSPIYKFFIDIGVQPADVNAVIADADAADVVMMICPSRGRASFIVNGAFDRPSYEANVRDYEGNTTLADAIARKRVLLMLGDEFTQAQYNNTVDPNDVNWMGNLHKSIWGGALTFVRMGGALIHDGWLGVTPNSSFWTGLDYGIQQRSFQAGSQDQASYMSGQKALYNAVNVGMAHGLNWWNGGIRTAGSVGGIPACWDMQDNGTSSGFIVGAGDTGSSNFPQGSRQNCSAGFSGVTKTVASPDWIEHCAQAAVDDPDNPFFYLWVWPGGSGGGLGPDATWAAVLEQRADYVSKLNSMVNICQARATWNGYRAAKVGVWP